MLAVHRDRPAIVLATIGATMRGAVDDLQLFGFDAGIGSISISVHKLMGTPLRCGTVLTRNQHVETLGRAIELVGVHGTTLSGSATDSRR